MRANFFGCCASAIAPHNANVTTMAKNPANFGFWILRHGSGQVLDFRLKEKESRIRIEDFLFIPFIFLNPKSAIQNLKSSQPMNFLIFWIKTFSSTGLGM